MVLTRDRAEVSELRPRRRPGHSATELVGAAQFCRDLDAVVDQTL